MAGESLQAKLTKRATTAGLVLRKGATGFGLADAATGTWVAAVWTCADGCGLSLDEIAAALDSL